MINFKNTEKVMSAENKCIDQSITSIEQIRFILPLLELTLIQQIDGDVVELGCYIGESAKQIRRMMNLYDSNKKFYVYDSFEGLPKPREFEFWGEGGLKTSEDKIILNFTQNDLELPVITKAWFKDIRDDQLPEKISFAFIDGDLYDSIYDGMSRIYNKLSYGAVVCIHDYERHDLPGVKRAVDDFFTSINKSERIQYKICDQLGVYIHV